MFGRVLVLLLSFALAKLSVQFEGGLQKDATLNYAIVMCKNAYTLRTAQWLVTINAVPTSLLIATLSMVYTVVAHRSASFGNVAYFFVDYCISHFLLKSVARACALFLQDGN